MAHAFDIKTLVPEEYAGFKIYTQKEQRRVGRYHQEIYRVQIRKDGQIVHDGLANYNFGVHTDNPTKEDVIDAAKKFISEDLSDFNAQTSTVKPGDLFYTSWGYDQTNYDYLMVIRVSPTGKTCVCRMVTHEEVGHTQQHYQQRPVPKPYGKEFQMKIDAYRGSIHLRGQYYYTRDDSKRFGSFTRVKPGDTYWETDTMFRH